MKRRSHAVSNTTHSRRRKSVLDSAWDHPRARTGTWSPQACMSATRAAPNAHVAADPAAPRAPRERVLPDVHGAAPRVQSSARRPGAPAPRLNPVGWTDSNSQIFGPGSAENFAFCPLACTLTYAPVICGPLLLAPALPAAGGLPHALAVAHRNSHWVYLANGIHGRHSSPSSAEGCPGCLCGSLCRRLPASRRGRSGGAESARRALAQ